MWILCCCSWLLLWACCSLLLRTSAFGWQSVPRSKSLVITASTQLSTIRKTSRHARNVCGCSSCRQGGYCRMGLAASSRRGLAVTTLSSTALRLSTSENIANTHPSTIDDDEHNDIDVDDDEDVSQVMEEMLAMDDTAVDVVEESLLDNAISNSITQMIINDRKLAAEGGLKTPLEKFEEIYAGIKSKKYDEDESQSYLLDPNAILQRLFDQPSQKEPFNDVKVMIKLQKLMNPDDFQKIFKDPMIGDFM